MDLFTSVEPVCARCGRTLSDGECWMCPTKKKGSPDLAREARDEGIERAERGASDAWKAAALDVVLSFVKKGREFTTDDVWDRLYSPPEPRALGAVMMALSKGGVIEKVGYQQSRRRECHARPIPIWRKA